MFEPNKIRFITNWQQILKSQQIADNMQQLDQWKQRSEDLLYSMIPQQIAVRLKNGEDPINTCEVTDNSNPGGIYEPSPLYPI